MVRNENGYEVCLIQLSDKSKIKLAGFETVEDAETYINKISKAIYLKPGQEFGIREVLIFEGYEEDERL